MAEKDKNKGKKFTGGRDFFQSIGDDETVNADEDSNTWAVSFSDISTILLIFFILLLSFSVINPNKFEMVQKSIVGAPDEETSIEQVSDELQELINKHDLDKSIELVKDELGLNINLRNEIKFSSGTSRLVGESRYIVSQLIVQLKKMPKKFTFYVEGHTDDVPIHKKEFPSNWHLSAARALTILEIFRERGIADKRLTVQGFADTKPLKEFPFKDANGNPIKKNREKNRRVVIKVR